MNKKLLKNDVKIELASLAPPGVKGEFVFVYLTKDDKKEDKEKFKDDIYRQFTVRAQLSKNNYILKESLQASVNEKNGDSFLIVPEYVEHSKVNTSGGEFICLQNDDNELSGIEFHCVACSLQEAKNKFHMVVIPFIDHLSYKANCPIHIPLISSEDIKNRCLMINYTSPYPKAKLNPHEINLDTNMLPIYALFREAKNTDSSYYKFLCYYKILEGIYNHLRPEMHKIAREKKIEIQNQKEHVPDHPELKRFHPEFIGKPIKSLFDNELRKQYRDAIAHFLLDNGAILNVSDFKINSQYSNIILIIELCCKTVIDTQENYYKQMKKG